MNVEKLEVSFIVNRSIKWHNHFGKHLGSFLEVKYIPTIRLSHSTPGHLLKGNGNIFMKQNLVYEYTYQFYLE